MKQTQNRYQQHSKREIFLEGFCSVLRDIIIYSFLFVIVGLLFLALTKDVQADNIILEEPEVAQGTEETHFMVEYYVNSKRYVRTLNIKNIKLIEGTAKDLGIVPSHLIAMCIQEASVASPDGNFYGCDPEAIGDNFNSYGAFQIHLGYHKIPKEDAKHLYYSARWTAERLLQKGYKRNKERAIRCHNSCRPDNKYGERVLQIAKTLKPIS